MDRTNHHSITALIMRQRAAILVAALCMISGCRVNLTRQEVIGSWECTRGPRLSCIDILDDGTYQQVILVNGARELSSTSVWRWEEIANEGMGISFKGFHTIRNDGSAVEEPPGWWAVIPDRRILIGSPELVVFEDEGIAFTKRKTPCPKGES